MLGSIEDLINLIARLREEGINWGKCLSYWVQLMEQVRPNIKIKNL